MTEPAHTADPRETVAQSAAQWLQDRLSTYPNVHTYSDDDLTKVIPPYYSLHAFSAADRATVLNEIRRLVAAGH